MKKICSAFLSFLFLFFSSMPQCFAADIAQKVADDEVIPAKSKIKLEFNQNFNANECEIGDSVEFRLKEAITDGDNVVLAKGTRFVARVTDKDKSKFFYRRAIAHIRFEKIILNDGSQYLLVVNPKDDELKSPEALNLAKAAASTALCAGVCMVGAVVIAVECMSLAGILFLPYAGIAIGGAIGITSKGLNYKAHKGTPLTIALKEPLRLNFHRFDDGACESDFFAQ